MWGGGGMKEYVHTKRHLNWFVPGTSIGSTGSEGSERVGKAQ